MRFFVLLSWELKFWLYITAFHLRKGFSVPQCAALRFTDGEISWMCVWVSGWFGDFSFSKRYLRTEKA